ncbi:hypothetical protein GQ457_04G002110 [Hibiscus cannabinus]
MTGSSAPCGACKVFEKKICSRLCFAPYFCHEQGATHFEAIHKIPQQGSLSVPDVQSWFHSENPSMAPNFNPKTHTVRIRVCDPNSLANYEKLVSSSGEDHVSYISFEQASHSCKWNISKSHGSQVTIKYWLDFSLTDFLLLSWIWI